MILDQIVQQTQLRLEALKSATDVRTIEKRLIEATPPRGFRAALEKAAREQNRLGLIAEIKKASPSRGVIAPDFDVQTQATLYRDSRADCLSVLTEPDFFAGDLEHLTLARIVAHKPALRKDFILDHIQIAEARLAGADCVLLIVAILKDWEIRQLKAAASRYGMDALVEVHTEEEVRRALFNGCDFIGINNRDLHTFEVDLGTTERLRRLIPDECLVVAESGVATREDARRLREAGANALLVGETLMRGPNPADVIEELLA